MIFEEITQNTHKKGSNYPILIILFFKSKYLGLKKIHQNWIIRAIFMTILSYFFKYHHLIHYRELPLGASLAFNLASFTSKLPIFGYIWCHNSKSYGPKMVKFSQKLLLGPLSTLNVSNLSAPLSSLILSEGGIE